MKNIRLHKTYREKVSKEFNVPLYAVDKFGLLKRSICPKCGFMGHLWRANITKCISCGYEDTSEKYF